MKDGYKIQWTTNASEELERTIDYLQKNFTDKEITRLVLKIEETIHIISKNPIFFQESEIKNIQRAAILKYNTMYYRIKNDKVEILSFFSNRQDPVQRKI